MFERFTEQARQVVVLAQEEARSLRHNYIGTEHILLGLLRVEDGVVARVFGALAVTLEEVRTRIARIAPASDEVTSGQIPFTPRAKKVLELSLREALALGHNYIGPEHVLLGLLREGDGIAVRVLRDLDAHPDQIRQEILGLLPPGERQERGPSSGTLKAATGAATAEAVAGATARVSEPRFTVGPDRKLRRLLMAAAGQALADGREEYGLADLLAAAEAHREPPEAAGAA